MMNNVCLGDNATIIVNSTVLEGEITMISSKGINVKNEKGITFYKWCHVQKIESRLVNKIKKYEETLRFYAEREHIDSVYLGGGQYEYYDVESGNMARDVLKEENSHD